jgi:hypothetical protein
VQSVFHSNLDREFGSITEFWSPRVVAVANGQYVKLAKAKGEFVWHAHADATRYTGATTTELSKSIESQTAHLR